MTDNDPNLRWATISGTSSPLPGTGKRAFWVGLAVVILSLFIGLGTFLVLTGVTPIVPRNEVVLICLMLNVALILAMILVLSWQAVGLWRAWRDRVAGARLHIRIVGLFTIIAAVPALLLAAAATTTFSRALDSNFASRTRAIVDNSLQVAVAYLEEHGQIIRNDIVNMSSDMDEGAARLSGDLRTSREFQDLLTGQASLRDLSLAAIIDEKANVVISALNDTRVKFEPPSSAEMAQANAGQVVLMLSQDGYRIAAVRRLQSHPDLYLYVARAVDARVVGHLRRTQAGVAEYEGLRQRRGIHKFVHGVMYFQISLMSILAAIWVGLWFASRLVAPIRRLISAAQQVARGDLDVVLPMNRGEGDLRRLSKNFNNMTTQLAHQRNELVTANTQLLERRRFMEAVLSGVSAGVLGLDGDGRVTLANPSAETLLGRTQADLVGKPLQMAVPEFGGVLDAEEPTGIKARAPHQVKIMVGTEERSFAVRVTGDAAGAVVTFDDVTELVAAQRTSAWGDVARRIAHEIKNPLTPIQLSAERLKRKYGGSIGDDRETFNKLTDTIVRQVGDIKSMVDEFASFARMPKPEMERTDLKDAVLEPVILFRESHPNLTFEARLPDEPVLADCDRRLITQAVTNLVKNAAEAIATFADSPEHPADFKGRIEVVLRREGDLAFIEVIDNGIGLPRQNRNRLLEPYVTTKGHKGTGLGLAIVQKVTEQHGGSLTLEDAPPAPDRPSGALVRLTLPIRRRAGEARAGPTRDEHRVSTTHAVATES
jgi:two-component system nitrogen regulation sensor histidine kinase NtrY